VTVLGGQILLHMTSYSIVYAGHTCHAPDHLPACN
jgi:hypothetical protein